MSPTKNKENKEVRNFIYFLIHNNKITRKQQTKRDKLFARDCVKLIERKNYNKYEPTDSNEGKTLTTCSHVPKDTAYLLSLFNSPKGFKFLTHDFDPDSTFTFKNYIPQAQKVFDDKTKNHTIPKSLFALMKTMLEGSNKEWIDYNGKKHDYTYNSAECKEWISTNNGLHPLNNESFAKEIRTFRKTIRLVKPGLQDIANELASKFRSLNIESHGLDKADFYTYVRMLKDGLKRILEDMSRYAEKYPKVRIAYNRIFGDEYSLRIITITQIGSFSTSLGDVLQKYRNGGGAFNEIKKCFMGYCNWSVETKWDNKPLRWNILDDTGAEELENMEEDSIEGFTHILTYYSK